MLGSVPWGKEKTNFLFNIWTLTIRGSVPNPAPYSYLIAEPYRTVPYRKEKTNFLFNIWTLTIRGSVPNPAPYSYLIAEPYLFGFFCSDPYPWTKESQFFSQKLGPACSWVRTNPDPEVETVRITTLNKYPFKIFRFFPIKKGIFVLFLIVCAGSGFIFPNFRL
jgi:hypothetical protein